LKTASVFRKEQQQHLGQIKVHQVNWDNREEPIMTERTFPKWYAYTKDKHPEFMKALDHLGETVRKQGPLDEKTAHLIQLAAAAAIRSEGSVHSHTRRAIKAGATRDEVYHAILLLTSTIGFPTTSAAMSWASDVIEEK
jgi:4-carboxymuconolactone decarboxylase